MVISDDVHKEKTHLSPSGGLSRAQLLIQCSLQGSPSNSSTTTEMYGEPTGVNARFAPSGDRDHTVEGTSLGCWCSPKVEEESTCDGGRRRSFGIRLVVRGTTPCVRGYERNVAWRIQGRRALKRAIIGGDDVDSHAIFRCAFSTKNLQSSLGCRDQ